jgi:nitrite reductase/ring-hydroxylating ferredoxin subunit
MEFAPEPGTLVCEAALIHEGEARSFVFGEGAKRFELLVAKSGGRVFAYVNQCPHQGTPLDIWPNRIMSEDRRELVCGTHGARFRVEDGFCIGGPCAGKSLQRVAIKRQGENLAFAKRLNLKSDGLKSAPI